MSAKMKVDILVTIATMLMLNKKQIVNAIAKTADAMMNLARIAIAIVIAKIVIVQNQPHPVANKTSPKRV